MCGLIVFVRLDEVEGVVGVGCTDGRGDVPELFTTPSSIESDVDSCIRAVGPSLAHCLAIGTPAPQQQDVKPNWAAHFASVEEV